MGLGLGESDASETGRKYAGFPDRSDLSQRQTTVGADNGFRLFAANNIIQIGDVGVAAEYPESAPEIRLREQDQGCVGVGGEESQAFNVTESSLEIADPDISTNHKSASSVKLVSKQGKPWKDHLGD